MHHYPISRPIRDSGFTIAHEMPLKTKEDSSIFDPRLVALRKARGLTQVQLAEATKATQRSIAAGAAPRRNRSQGEHNGR